MSERGLREHLNQKHWGDLFDKSEASPSFINQYSTVEAVDDAENIRDLIYLHDKDHLHYIFNSHSHRLDS